MSQENAKIPWMAKINNEEGLAKANVQREPIAIVRRRQFGYLEHTLKARGQKCSSPIDAIHTTAQIHSGK